MAASVAEGGVLVVVPAPAPPAVPAATGASLPAPLGPPVMAAIAAAFGAAGWAGRGMPSVFQTRAMSMPLGPPSAEVDTTR